MILPFGIKQKVKLYSPFKGITPYGGVQFEFSTNSSNGHGDADHDNAKAIRTYKGIVAAFEN